MVSRTKKYKLTSKNVLLSKQDKKMSDEICLFVLFFQILYGTHENVLSANPFGIAVVFFVGSLWHSPKRQMSFPQYILGFTGKKINEVYICSRVCDLVLLFRLCDHVWLEFVWLSIGHSIELSLLVLFYFKLLLWCNLFWSTL